MENPGTCPYMILKSNVFPIAKGLISLSQVLDLFLRQRPVDGEFGQFPRDVALRTRARQQDLQSRGAVAAVERIAFLGRLDSFENAVKWDVPW